MSASMDTSLAGSQPESSSFLGKVASEVADFGEGLYHGAIESPIDGAVQLTNHLVGTHLPELHLVDQETLSHSVGGVLGNIAGTALDMYAATVATAGIASAIGGSGMIGAALRFGAVGAAYTTLLQPTDDKSETFFKDRLTNGAVAFGTFAAMGGAATALNGTGLFAASAARSLGGNLLYGGAVGAGGGLAHAEANAVLKEGQILPNLADLASDVGTYAAFGMAYGAADFAFNKVTAPAAKTFNSEGKTVTIQTDSQGNPVKVLGTTPALNHPTITVHYEGVKMTDGSWSSSAWEQMQNSNSRLFKGEAPVIENVTINGDQATISGGGIVREFKDGGGYKRIDVQEEAWKAESAARNAKYNKSEEIGGVTASRHYDDQMRLGEMHTTAPGANGKYLSSAYINYGQDGSISGLSVIEGQDASISLSRQSNGSWSVDTNNSNYNWKGDVQVLPATGPGHPDQIQFTPEGGGAPSNFSLTDSIKPVTEMMGAQATYVPGGTGRPVLRIDGQGNASLTGGTSSYQKSIVNDHPVASGETVPIKPGDSVQVNVDVGDRSAVYELRQILWTESPEGIPILGTVAIKPNTTLDFDINAGGTNVIKAAQFN